MSSDNEGPPPKRARLNFTQNIEVLVGESENETRFYVHPAIICARSPFFEAACERWKKASEPLKLVDDDPADFDYYLNCVYAGKAPQLADFGELVTRLANTYVLADKLGDLATANLLIDKMIKACEKEGQVVDAGVIGDTWQCLPDNSPLRRLFVDFYVLEIKSEFFNSSLDSGDLPVDYVYAVAKEMHRLVDSNRKAKIREVFNNWTTDKPKCYYHQHDASYPRCSDGKAEGDACTGTEQGDA